MKKSNPWRRGATIYRNRAEVLRPGDAILDEDRFGSFWLVFYVEDIKGTDSSTVSVRCLSSDGGLRGFVLGISSIVNFIRA